MNTTINNNCKTITVKLDIAETAAWRSNDVVSARAMTNIVHRKGRQYVVAGNYHDGETISGEIVAHDDELLENTTDVVKNWA